MQNKETYNINDVVTYTHKTDDDKYITRLETKDKKYHLVGYRKSCITQSKLSALKFLKQIITKSNTN